MKGTAKLKAFFKYYHGLFIFLYIFGLYFSNGLVLQGITLFVIQLFIFVLLNDHCCISGTPQMQKLNLYP